MIRDNRGVIKANKYEASSSLPIATNNTNASLRDSKFDNNNNFFEDCRDNKSITESMESNEFNGANESVLFDSNVDGQESRKRLSCFCL